MRHRDMISKLKFNISMWNKVFWSKDKLVHLFYMSNLESSEADFDICSDILPAASEKADLPSCIPRHLSPE